MRYLSIVGLAFLILACGSGGQSGPDLAVELRLDSNITSEVGRVVKLSATVSNEGNAESDSTILRYYQSSDGSVTQNLNQLLG